MFSLLLALHLITQNNSPYTQEPKFTHPPAAFKDMVFTQFQEEWVYQAHKGAIFDWYKVLPQEDADLLIMINAREIACRRHGQKHLRELGYKGIKITTWGLHAKSGEIQLVCQQNMARLYQCTFCKGTGEVTETIDNDIPGELGEIVMNSSRCRGCGGSGTFYARERYNYQSGEKDIVKRNIFLGGNAMTRNAVGLSNSSQKEST